MARIRSGPAHAVELHRLQRSLLTTELTGAQWLACLGLALLLPLVVEGSKWVRRRQAHVPEAPLDVAAAVTPARARVSAQSVGGDQG